MGAKFVKANRRFARLTESVEPAQKGLQTLPFGYAAEGTLVSESP